MSLLSATALPFFVTDRLGDVSLFLPALEVRMPNDEQRGGRLEHLESIPEQ